MSNLTKLDFTTLDISNENNLSWILNVEIHLEAKGLEDTRKPGNNAPMKDRAQAIIFLCHHLLKSMKK